jgi:hypothetical protein
MKNIGSHKNKPTPQSIFADLPKQKEHRISELRRFL